MKIEKLLFVTKFQQLCYDALQSLLNLRKANLEHIVFLNVIERDNVFMYRTGYKKDEEIRLREAANIRFIDWAEKLFEQGMEVGVYIVVGSVVSQIIKAAKKEAADLIVIGRPHKGVLEQFYSGSDVAELIRRASIPVLVFKDMPDDPVIAGKPFERPLIAMDWSPASLRTIDYLKGLKDVIKEAHIVYVVDDRTLKGPTAMAIQKTRKETRAKLQTICDDLEADGIEAKPHVYVGNPDKELETAAKECNCTMIVLGSSGKPSWKERWIGSTPLHIAEKSAYPALLVPPE